MALRFRPGTSWIDACSVFTLLLIIATRLAGQDQLASHKVMLDSRGKILSWVQPQGAAYDRVMRLAWDFLLHKAPVETNRLKAFYSYCCLDPDSLRGTAWPHNPAGLYAMLVDSAVPYYAYSGDRAVVDLIGGLLDYQLDHGTTPPDWEWGSVPYASADHGATEYRGAHDFLYDKRMPGRGDGYGVIEPDKVGELGYGYLRFYELTGAVRYRQAAIACADALARHVRAGDASRSPWPFRVYAETAVPREEYSSNVIGPIRLFDELTRLNLGEVPAYRRARQMAWDWMMTYPIKNKGWGTYFEDVPIFEKPENLNQYSPMETARYLLQHPEFDPEWRTHVARLIEWVERTFVVDVPPEQPKERAVQYGANVVSEQTHYMPKMGSHTARYASVLALWHEVTGDAEAKEKAFRSFNWATYMCRDDGAVQVGPILDRSIWFTDGYGDYIRHFMAGLGSIPEWAPPNESHLLRSSSVVRSVSYLKGEVNYLTFDDSATEVLRIDFRPHRVLFGGNEAPKRSGLTMPGWTFDEPTGIVRIRHENSNLVRILGE
jgi:hypothetical protein